MAKARRRPDPGKSVRLCLGLSSLRFDVSELQTVSQCTKYKLKSRLLTCRSDLSVLPKTRTLSSKPIKTCMNAPCATETTVVVVAAKCLVLRSDCSLDSPQHCSCRVDVAAKREENKTTCPTTILILSLITHETRSPARDMAIAARRSYFSIWWRAIRSEAKARITPTGTVRALNLLSVTRCGPCNNATISDATYFYTQGRAFDVLVEPPLAQTSLGAVQHMVAGGPGDAGNVP